MGRTFREMERTPREEGGSWKDRIPWNKYFLAGLVMTGLALALGILGLFWTPYSTTAMSASEKFDPPSLLHIFGTDNFGRDLFSRVLEGGRTSLLIAFCTVCIGAACGAVVGSLTGYFGGSKSCIGLAVSASPEEPFRFVGLIVCSPAGWRTPNAIDPQFFEGENGRQFLVYGSFGMGLFLVELDPATGLRLDGASYGDYRMGKLSFADYYGTNLADGSLEGGAIRYHAGVDVLERGKWIKKNYYYLTCSYGSLSSAYHIRCGRSERPEGPYLDVNGNKLVCSTDLGTGNKLFGSFKRQGEPDYFCPGHNDLYVTDRGVKLVVYHCRTNDFIEKKLSNHSLDISKKYVIITTCGTIAQLVRAQDS